MFFNFKKNKIKNKMKMQNLIFLKCLFILLILISWLYFYLVLNMIVCFINGKIILIKNKVAINLLR